MSSEEEQEIAKSTSQSRRSRRGHVSSAKSKQQSALETLKQARAKGSVYRQKVDDLIPELYDEVDDAVYQAKKLEQRTFVDKDGGEAYSTESNESDGYNSPNESQSRKNRKAEKKGELKKGNIKQMFQLMNKNQVQDERLIKLDSDDILKECLATISTQDSYTGVENNDPGAHEDVVFSSTIESDKNAVIIRHRNPLNNEHVESPCVTKPKSSKDDKPSLEIFPQKNPFKRTTSPVPSARPIKISRPIIVEEFRDLSDFDAKDTNFSMSEKKEMNIVDSKEELDLDNYSVKQINSKNSVRFYYLDAYEDPAKHPSVVYLFGRLEVGKNLSESCCVVVKNVYRQIFFVKRNKKISDQMLVDEVVECMKTHFNISNFRHKKGEKKFICKNSKLPKEGEVLEVHFDANFGRVPAEVDGDQNLFGRYGKSFSHVFNTSSTALERVITELEIKGPGWLELTDAVKVDSGVSYCKHEFDVDMTRMKGLCVIPSSLKNAPPPPIRLLSLNILAVINETENERQIVMISFLYNDNCSLLRPQLGVRDLKRFCIVASLKGQTLPFNLNDILKQKGIGQLVTAVNDERTLLNAFLAKLTMLDPDLVITPDLSDQLDFLTSRIEKYRLRNWAQLGRLKRSGDISKLNRSKTVQWLMTAGRPWLDLKSAASELAKLRSFEMSELVAQLLRPSDNGIMKRIDLSANQISDPFISSMPKISMTELIDWSWMELLFCLKIIDHLNAIPLFVQITQIVGGIMSRTLMGGRSERNEYLLLHSCYKNKFIAPDKPFSSKGVESKGAQYTGGLVLEPKKGLYETFIVLLDFNSLYPSIIQEFNICFTTVDEAFLEVKESDLPQMPERTKPDGILKTEIRELVSRRREVKSLMKKVPCDSELYKQYNVRQLGLKLTANSMYGCLGLPQFRFYAKTLAAMITAKGREVLLRAKDIVEADGFSVIYGDTDSIMVNTNCNDLENAKRIGYKLKQIVNKNYELLELDIDGIYKKLLLLKKKKYAGLSVDMNNEQIETVEMKGLDIVRRDWSMLAKEIGEQIVSLILSPMSRDDLVSEIRCRLSELKQDVEEGKISLEKYEILKQLTQSPEDYRDTNTQPHVLVANRLNVSQKFNFKKGDVIKYVICRDGSTKSATQRSYHPSEVLGNPDLPIDTKYYLEHQVHPVISRICEPIEELAIVIAEVLGLDTTRFYQRYADVQTNEEAEFGIGLEQDFDGCEGFSFECMDCKKLSIIRSAVLGKGQEARLALEKCPGCSADFSPMFGVVMKQLILAMKSQVSKNIECPYVCDDVTCNAETKVPNPEQWTADGCICMQCQNGIMKKSYPCKKLFDQQCFYKKIFDLEAFLHKECAKEEQFSLRSRPYFKEVAKDYKKCLDLVDRYISLNDFNKVDLSIVFAPLFKFPNKS